MIDNLIFDRTKMVEDQLMKRGIKDPKILKIIKNTDRSLFIPGDMRKHSYEDRPLNIGYNQTISQPFIVAFMTETANIKSTSNILEIGTGSGYQTSILSQLSKEVYTIELIPELSQTAKEIFKKLGYDNINMRIGDGYNGWEEKAPFDVIIVTAAPEEVPLTLIKQLKDGGRLIIPVGDEFKQELIKITRTKNGIKKETLLPVRFVPMVREEPVNIV